MTHLLNVFVIYPDPLATTLALFKTNVLEFFYKIDKEVTNELISVEDRIKQIIEVLERNKIDPHSLDAVVGRGGFTKSVESGVYEVNESLVADLKTEKYGKHASNYGGILAFKLGKKLNKPAYIVDPVTLDELEAIAKVSGLPEVQRRTAFHALAHKTAARRTAIVLGKRYEECNFVTAHIGAGVSVGVHRKGKEVDVSNALDESAFSVERAGRLPIRRFIKLCYSGKYTKEELEKKIRKESGIYAHLGTKNIALVDKMIRDGDKKAELILKSMTYQLAKDIGAYATVVKGKLDAIIVSGRPLGSKFISKWIREYVGYLGPLFFYPEEIEVQGLADRVYQVLMGEESVKNY